MSGDRRKTVRRQEMHRPVGFYSPTKRLNMLDPGRKMGSGLDDETNELLAGLVQVVLGSKPLWRNLWIPDIPQGNTWNPPST